MAKTWKGKKKVRRRRRGTAIVETKKGILVASGRKKLFILPGGGANKNESRRKAAMRELREETGLTPISAKILFKHKGPVHKAHGGGFFQDYSTICLVKAKGKARPRHEVKHIAYYKPGSKVRISNNTKRILKKYYNYKKKFPKKQSTGLFKGTLRKIKRIFRIK